jgi:hypothetical protein
VREQRIREGQQRVRSTFLAVALLALVTGCSSDTEQPRAELPPASSSAAETTPELPPLGPEDFPVPDEARTQDEAGAEVFVRYWVDLLNRQIRVPAGGPLRELAPDCNECLRIARDLDDAAEAGRRYRGGQISIDGDFGTASVEDGVNIAFFARVAPGALLDESGSAVSGTVTDEQRLPSAALVGWSDDHQSWLMKALNFG